jgi:hypothetical protein
MNVLDLRRAVLGMENKCCSDMLLMLALSDIGQENDTSIAALAEHCADAIDCVGARRGRRGLTVDDMGVWHVGPVEGSFCGALAAAVAVLYAAKGDDLAVDCQDELMDWFDENFGSFDCRSLAFGASVGREDMCPRLILATYLQLRNYLDPDNHLSQKTLDT